MMSEWILLKNKNPPFNTPVLAEVVRFNNSFFTKIKEVKLELSMRWWDVEKIETLDPYECYVYQWMLIPPMYERYNGVVSESHHCHTHPNRKRIFVNKEG